MDTWKQIFSQSPANNGFYDGDSLPIQKWDWPKTTWFQARRQWLRESARSTAQKSARNGS